LAHCGSGCRRASRRRPRVLSSRRRGRSLLRLPRKLAELTLWVAFHQVGKPVPALDQRLGAQILPVKVEKINGDEAKAARLRPDRTGARHSPEKGPSRLFPAAARPIQPRAVNREAQIVPPGRSAYLLHVLRNTRATPSHIPSKPPGVRITRWRQRPLECMLTSPWDKDRLSRSFSEGFSFKPEVALAALDNENLVFALICGGGPLPAGLRLSTMDTAPPVFSGARIVL
jgi:hypothetical protein